MFLKVQFSSKSDNSNFWRCHPYGGNQSLCTFIQETYPELLVKKSKNILYVITGWPWLRDTVYTHSYPRSIEVWNPSPEKCLVEVSCHLLQSLHLLHSLHHCLQAPAMREGVQWEVTVLGVWIGVGVLADLEFLGLVSTIGVKKIYWEWSPY